MSARITQEPLDASALAVSLMDEGMGGIATFVGVVRRSAVDGDVVAIEYSAYDAMAEEECERILADAAARWPMARVELRHRLGYVRTGEPSVVVVAAAPHRAEAFAACRFVIDETKRRVPIWKKEHLGTGGSRWVDAPPPEAARGPVEGPADA